MHNQANALSHLRVLDLSQRLAGSYCTKLMAGFGAETIKVEPPGGEPMRHCPPFVEGQPGTERSLPFLWFNTGKKSVVLDLSAAEGKAQLQDWVRQVDVLVEDGLLQDLDLNLAQLNPQLIVTSISNFGQSGPYRDYQAEEITLYAMSGLMYGTGDPHQAPLAGGPAIAHLSAGMKAYIATLMADYRREITGEGDRIEVSIQEAAMDNIEIAIAEYLHLGKIAKRSNDEHALVPWRTFPCKDGHAAIMGGPIRHWLKGAELFESPELVGPQYAHMEGRIRYREEVRQLMAPWLLQHGKQEIFHAGQARKLAWGYLATLQEVLESPQLQARQFFLDTEHPELGKYPMVGAPFRPSKTPWQQVRAPLLGENTFTAAQPRQRPQTPAAVRPQPLQGIRIVDFTHDWAGPHATRLLADYGAQTIKIEYPPRLDGMRGAYLDRKNRHPRWWQMNRNKASITLDLHQPEQVEAAKELIRQSDIVVDNSRPGVMAGWGLGYEVLKELRPDIILVSMSAFGATGPESQYAGYGGCIEALSGLQGLTAYSRQGDAMRVREMDVTNGIMGACAAMTALIYRQQTGEGQWVDLSQREACTWLMGEHLLEFVLNGTQTLPIGNRHPVYNQGCYRALGEDRWLVLTLRSDEEWQRFCQVCGHPEWSDDPRFKGRRDRHQHHDELDGLIESWTSTQTAPAAMQQLQAARLAAGMVQDVSTLAQDEHLQQRQWFQTAIAEGGTYPGFPFRFAKGGGILHRRGPDLGADNQAILCDLLGKPASFLPALDDEYLGTAFDLE
ncbi:CoA transferase [Oscillatoria amoena NRMC-F 0135]|nr:CoA transferase [Geitlerinema splendidum]MDL5051689.1 CoA transferase [Oscillatoria amoena NRMC-F 0135]